MIIYAYKHVYRIVTYILIAQVNTLNAALSKRKKQNKLTLFRFRCLHLCIHHDIARNIDDF